MTPDWRPLAGELARWTRAGLTLPLWWRDDDAIAATPALDKLTELSARLSLPVHLAVIPSLATPSLATHIATTPLLIPLVHGWAHLNHAPKPAKKAEFGAHRPAATMARECADGLARLRALFGPRACPVFVPPWNRIAPDLTRHLHDAGYAALSTFAPRSSEFAAPGLHRINTHLDPVAWHSTRSLADPDRLIAQIVHDLADRRLGRADNTEPYGLLTHHLIHDAALWSFIEELLRRLLDAPVSRWRANDLPDPKGFPT